jgi:hypothetical protein
MHFLTGLVQMFSLYPATCPVIFDRMTGLVVVECVILLIFLILLVFSTFCLCVTVSVLHMFETLCFIAGYELAATERTCVVPEAFLLFARKENIGRISIENGNNDAIIPVTGVKDARYVSRLRVCLPLHTAVSVIYETH